MKIHDMTTKQWIEVQDTDLLIIEDEEDTKAITVSNLREVMTRHTDDRSKKFINATIDKIIVALQNVKYSVANQRQYVIYARIDSISSGVVIAFKDALTNKWLATEEVLALTHLVNEHGTADFKVQMLINEIYEEAQVCTVLNFSDLYGDSLVTALDKELYAANAGVVLASFFDLSQNDLASVTHEDVVVSLPLIEIDFEMDVDDDFQLKFTTSKDFFVNNVPYEGVV